MTKDELKLAFQKAFQMGQDYWYHADHEFESYNKKSDAIRAKFNEMVEETIKEALAQPEQETNKNGSPCPEFWDWLPKAYNFEGDGNFTKYNMEVAFLAGKQASQPEPPPECQTEAEKTAFAFGWFKAMEAQRKQEPVAIPDCGEAGHADGACGNRECLPSFRRSTTPPPVPEAHKRTAAVGEDTRRAWVGLDEEDDIDWEEGGSLRDLVEAVEAKLKEKNNG